MATRHVSRRGAPRGARARSAGTSRRTVWPARRRSRSSSAASATSRSTARSALLGLGSGCAVGRRRRRPGTHAGRPRSREALADASGPTIVCAQAGDVNTGAFDPFEEIARARGRARRLAARRRRVRPVGRARAPTLRHLDRAASSRRTPGRPTRTSGSTSRTTAGSPSSRDPRRAPARPCGCTAAYLVAEPGAARDQIDWTPELSRRARGFAVYAALRSLGRDGRRRDGRAARARTPASSPRASSSSTAARS